MIITSTDSGLYAEIEATLNKNIDRNVIHHYFITLDYIQEVQGYAEQCNKNNIMVNNPISNVFIEIPLRSLSTQSIPVFKSAETLYQLNTAVLSSYSYKLST